MESVTTEIKFVAPVSKVEEKKDREYIGGVGDTAQFNERSIGWFVHLKGSYESLYIGPDKPNIKVGDIATVRITFNAKPSQAPK